MGYIRNACAGCGTGAMMHPTGSGHFRVAGEILSSSAGGFLGSSRMLDEQFLEARHPLDLKFDGTRMSSCERPDTGWTTCRPVEHRHVRRQLNWRGPVWMPVNALIIRALQNYYRTFGDTFTIECNGVRE
jgi:hypothetical protein